MSSSTPNHKTNTAAPAGAAAAGLNVNLFAAAAAAPNANAPGSAVAPTKMPLSSPIADFSWVSESDELGGVNFDDSDPASVALEALRRTSAQTLPTSTPPLMGSGAGAGAALPSLSALPAAAATHESLLARHMASSALAAGVSVHPFSLSLSASAPPSPSFSLAGDSPDSPSSIASDLSSASSLMSGAASPRITTTATTGLPRHSSTPSLAALAAAHTPHFSFGASPAAAFGRVVTPPQFPSLKPALRGAKPSASAAAAAPAFSLSGAGAGAGAGSDGEDDQPSKKKLKVNDSSMRRVKSSPAVAVIDEDDASDDDSAAAAAAAAKLAKPIALLTKDGKPRPEAEIKREKQERRLAKKAEAARQSRKRKKAYVQQLEEKAAKLEARLAQLEAQTANASGATPVPASPSPAASASAAAAAGSGSGSGAGAMGLATPAASSQAMAKVNSLHALHREEQTEVLGRLSKAVALYVALTQPNPSAALTASAPPKERVLEDIKALIERVVVNSRKRQQTVTYYLDRMGELLAPEASVRVALWGLSQPDSYYAVGGTGGVFSALMTQEVGLTPQQLTKAVSEFRAPVNALLEALKKTALNITEMREFVKTHIAQRNRHVDELRHILHPIQVANYLLWLEKNSSLAQALSKSPVTTATVVTAPTAYGAVHAHGK